jgi:hypothetical protein
MARRHQGKEPLSGSPAGRLLDRCRVSDELGPYITGSANVLINNCPAVRTKDIGMHSQAMWSAGTGAPTVLVNNQFLHRMLDKTRVGHADCGALVEGSPNVLVGDNKGSPTVGPYKRRFVILNAQSRQPLSGVPYRIMLASGIVIAGVTDSRGETQLVETAGPELIRLTIPSRRKPVYRLKREV